MKNIVPNENCLTEAQLLRYVRDECPPAEEKAIDRHLTDCPMCSDALEGAMLLNVPRLERSLHHLEAKIETQYSDKKFVAQTVIVEDEPVMTVVHKPKRRVWLWAAASVAVLAVVGFWLLTKPMDYNMALPPIADVQSSDSMLSQAQAAVPTTDSPQTGTARQTQKTNTGTAVVDANPAVSTDKDVAATNNKVKDANTTGQSPVATTTTNAPQNAVQPNYTEGGIVVAKESKVQAEDAQLNEVVVSDVNKKSAKQTREVKPPSAPTINSYPGAAAQNNASVQMSKAKQSVDDGITDYQIGMRFYQKGSYNEAIAPLNRVLAKQPTPDIYQNALWYLANSYLKLNKKPEARGLLQRIVSEKGKYAQQATALLD